jgi:hypothetical protein
MQLFKRAGPNHRVADGAQFDGQNLHSESLD